MRWLLKRPRGCSGISGRGFKFFVPGLVFVAFSRRPLCHSFGGLGLGPGLGSLNGFVRLGRGFRSASGLHGAWAAPSTVGRFQDRQACDVDFVQLVDHGKSASFESLVQAFRYPPRSIRRILAEDSGKCFGSGGPSGRLVLHEVAESGLPTRRPKSSLNEHWLTNPLCVGPAPSWLFDFGGKAKIGLSRKTGQAWVESYDKSRKKSRGIKVGVQVEMTFQASLGS